jgi:hypothetical protein
MANDTKSTFKLENNKQLETDNPGFDFSARVEGL